MYDIVITSITIYYVNTWHLCIIYITMYNCVYIYYT